MSYRAFKHLLGETSLERKCRFLLGGGILLLITASFWLYARMTEHLAYDQAITACRMLVNPILARKHVDADRREVLDLFQEQWEGVYHAALHQYKTHVILPDDPKDAMDTSALREFQSDPDLQEDTRHLRSRGIYYGSVRPAGQCMACHSQALKKADGKPVRPFKDADILLVRIRVPTEATERDVHVNRAILISTALVTALLIMTGSYLIIRYVIVKPVKHLKEVSDAISAGELNVRSEIQTGDEFEDLSHAFNRMLRNLVSMQDRLRKVNADLDHRLDELARANMSLYQSNKLKSDFLATMSHELRTPLNSILGFSDVLTSGDGLNDKQNRWVQNIRTSGERLLALINDILDLAKIEAGKMEIRVQECNIGDLAEGLLNMFRPIAQKKNIDLRSQIDPGVPPLRQDPGKLQQILSNLLSNAIKFTPEGGRVLLRAGSDVRNLILTVTDTGVGIAVEDQELVFERFRQAGNPLTREHQGTGLGLSIVRELSKLLGGEVTLKSELGRGSTFTVALPLQLSEQPRLDFDLARERMDWPALRPPELWRPGDGQPEAPPSTPAPEPMPAAPQPNP